MIRSPNVPTVPSRFIMFVSFAGMSATNYGFGLAAGWLLSPGDFGLLAFVQTLLTIAGLVLSSGFVWSLTAALVDASAARRAALVRGAVAANLLLSLAMSGAILLLFSTQLLRSGLESWAVTALVAVTLPAISLVAMVRATAQGHEHFGVLAALLLVETTVKAAVGIGLVLAGYGALGAVAGFLVGACAAALLGLIYLMRSLHVAPWGAFERPEMHTAGAMFSALLGMALLLNLDTMSMKLLLPDDRAAVGRYQAGIVLANMPYYLMAAIIPVLFTEMARVKRIGRTGQIVGDTLRMALLILLPIEALLAAFPKLFLGVLFPPSYLGGAATLRILAIGNAAIILLAVLSTAFQATGQSSIPGRILLATTACEAAFLWVAVPIWQGEGAAYTFLTATLIALVLLGTAYSVRLDEFHAPPVLAWLGRYALAVLAGAAACGVTFRASGSATIAAVTAVVGYTMALAGLRLLSLRSSATRSPAPQPTTAMGDE